MLLSLRMVLTIAVLTLPVRSVIGDDLGERYTESLGHAFWVEKNTERKDGDFIPKSKLAATGRKEKREIKSSISAQK